MAIAYFPMYGSYEEIFSSLTDAQLGALIRGSLHYFNSGEKTEIGKPVLLPLYAMLCRDIDYSGEAYEEKCEKSRASARKRWHKDSRDPDASLCDRMPTDADACDRMPNKGKGEKKTKATAKASARAKKEDAPAPAEEREDCLAAVGDGPDPSSGADPVSPAEPVHAYGSFSNVPLTDAQYERLKREIPEAEDYIDRLSEHIASTGKTYADCCATIFKWVREDRRRSPPKPDPAPSGSFDTDEFFEAALKRSQDIMESMEADRAARALFARENP